MAERVQADLELMLTKLEQMQRVGLLNQPETEQIGHQKEKKIWVQATKAEQS